MNVHVPRVGAFVLEVTNVMSKIRSRTTWFVISGLYFYDASPQLSAQIR
jgi:hypothetical protein